jgi:hypothetical protein
MHAMNKASSFKIAGRETELILDTPVRSVESVKGDDDEGCRREPGRLETTDDVLEVDGRRAGLDQVRHGASISRSSTNSSSRKLGRSWLRAWKETRRRRQDQARKRPGR